jgi:hypothetical protein
MLFKNDDAPNGRVAGSKRDTKIRFFADYGQNDERGFPALTFEFGPIAEAVAIFSSSR